MTLVFPKSPLTEAGSISVQLASGSALDLREFIPQLLKLEMHRPGQCYVII